MTKVNHIHDDAKNKTVPKDLLDSIYIGQLVGSATKFFGIPVHFGSFTDVNIWSRTLSIDEMINWTNCR